MKEISNSEIVFDKSGNEEMVSRLGKAIPKKMNFAIGLIDFCHYFLFGQIKKRMREISYSEIVFHKNVNDEVIIRLRKTIPQKMDFAVGHIDF